jgi:O-antigen ligase
MKLKKQMKNKFDLNIKEIKINQFLLNLFGFFLALPIIDIFGLSITFYIFILIVLFQIKDGLIIFKIDKTAILFFTFFFLGVISTLSPPPLLKEMSPYFTLKTILQFFYWISMALFFKTYLPFINLKSFSKYIFIGLFISAIAFYFFPIHLESNILSINFRFTRNAFVYNVLAFFPLIFWYILNSHLRRLRWIFVIFFIFSILFSGGRAGFVLILIQFLLLLPIIYIATKKIYIISLFGILFMLSLWVTFENSPIFDLISKKVEVINPRAASLINKSGTEGDLTVDRSWLLRKLMVDKAIEINKEFPYLGIGWFNFSNFGARIETQNEYERMQGFESNYLNTRSAHNSYAQYLAEGGILGLTILIVILLMAIKNIFFFKLLKGSFNINDLSLIALFTLMIYFYAISSMSGANTWLLIGLNFGINYNFKKI